MCVWRLMEIIRFEMFHYICVRTNVKGGLKVEISGMRGYLREGWGWSREKKRIQDTLRIDISRICVIWIDSEKFGRCVERRRQKKKVLWWCEKWKSSFFAMLTAKLESISYHFFYSRYFFFSLEKELESWFIGEIWSLFPRAAERKKSERKKKLQISFLIVIWKFPGTAITKKI